MKLSPAALKTVQSSAVAPGNIYPAKGGRKSPGTDYWLVVALTTHGAACIGFDKDGNPCSAAQYLQSALRERPIIGRVDLGRLELNTLP